MASKNITTIVSIILVIAAFLVGVYLPKLFNKDANEQIEALDVPKVVLAEASNTEIEIKQTPDYRPIKVQLEGKKNYKTDIVFADMDAGKEVSLSAFRGKLVVLNLWRTACNACKYELEGLVNMKQLYAGKPIEFIALSLDSRGASNVYHFLDQNKINLKPVYMDINNTVKRQYKTNKLPETLFIGPTGEILGIVKQPINWSDKESKRLLDTYLIKTGLD